MAVVWLAATRPTLAASWLLRPGALFGLLMLNLVILGVRSWSVWDAWEGAVRPAHGAWLAVAVAMTALPHLGVGWLQVRTIQALETVFVVPSGSAPSTIVPTPTGTRPPPTPSATDPAEAPATTPPPTPAPSELPPWGEHLTVLLLGSDAGPDRTGTRTDAMLVLNVVWDTADMALFSLPRNLRGFPFAEVPDFADILNAVYQQGESLPDLFGGPDPGAAAVVSVAEQMTGLDIDYFAVLDFYAFVSVVNALGGVTVDVPYEISYPAYRLEDGSYISITLPPGVQRLDGDEALAFVRSRKTGSDYGRMERQRCLVSALISQAEMSRLLVGLPGLISTFEDRVTTDIPLVVLPEMLTLVARTEVDTAAVVAFGPPLWHRGWIDGGWPVPDVDKIRAATARVLAGDTSVLGNASVSEAGPACGLPES